MEIAEETQWIWVDINKKYPIQTTEREKNGNKKGKERNSETYRIIPKGTITFMSPKVKIGFTEELFEKKQWL